MRVEILDSAPGGDNCGFLTTLVVDGAVAVDAGAIGIQRLSHQEQIADVLLTHAHLDHVATLPVFIENLLRDGRREPVRLHASAPTIRALRAHVFNDVIWPDFFALTHDGLPMVEVIEFVDRIPFRIGRLTFEPVRMNHPIETHGFVVQDADGVGVALAADTGPTDVFWEVARGRGVQAVFLESSFPNRLDRLAAVSGHLTPASFVREIDKLGSDVRAVAYHVKARYRLDVERELLALGDHRVEVGICGREYLFT